MSDILEKGDVYFLYWPAAGASEVAGLPDVQRFLMVLKPEGEEAYRRLVVGQKKLPDPDAEGGGARYWGFVDRVVQGAREAFERDPDADLGGPAPRPAGEGTYAIARHEGHTDIVYALRLPEEPGEAQRDLRIEKEAAYLLSIKNPEAEGPRGVGLDADRKADLPDDLKERFGDRRWTSADPPAFLDHEGTEFLLVAGREDVPEDVAAELRSDEVPALPVVAEELRLDADDERVTKPLYEGEWR